jgi:hypothetical protein
MRGILRAESGKKREHLFWKTLKFVLFFILLWQIRKKYEGFISYYSRLWCISYWFYDRILLMSIFNCLTYLINTTRVFQSRFLLRPLFYCNLLAFIWPVWVIKNSANSYFYFYLTFFNEETWFIILRKSMFYILCRFTYLFLMYLFWSPKIYFQQI